MHPRFHFFALPIVLGLSLYGCGCFVPVTEKQCDDLTPCGSGWVCIGGVCHPPNVGGGSGSLGGGAGGGAGGVAGAGGAGGAGVGGGSAGGAGGGGAGTGGGSGCTGCVTPAGVCVAGTAFNACGAKGAACQACSSSQACINNACVSTTGCTPANCPNGCCRNGTCVQAPMQSAQGCGLNGATCAPCGAGEACFFGKCAASSTCNATTCPAGCCSGDICLSTAVQTINNCGNGGNVCKACPAGQLCVNGACTMMPCTASNCPNGCCDQNKCVPFAMQSSSACGRFGQACLACQPGFTCSAGFCNPPPCGPTTCGGCCNAAGACQPGTNQFACGTNGNACQACGTGQNCVNKMCSAPTKKVGDSCATTPECAAIGPTAYCKLQTSTGNALYPGGFCTRACGADAGTPSCTTDSVCVGSLGTYGEDSQLCLPRCGMGVQCRTPGYACYFINSVSTNACWLNPIPPTTMDAGTGSQIGNPCANASQCTNPSNAFCIQDIVPPLGATGFVGGYCSSLCSGMACASGSSCQSVTGFSGSITQPVCLKECPMPRTGQSSCRTGYICEGTIGAALGVCLPRCNNTGASCPTGMACNTMTGYCN